MTPPPPPIPAAAPPHRASKLRRNLLWAVGVCLAADLALVGWLFSPVSPSKAATQQQLASNKIQLAGLRAQSTQLHLLNHRIHDSQEQIQELMAEGIPQENEISSKLLTELSRIAIASQVQVSGAEFHPDKYGHLGLRRYAVNLQVAGSYAGAVRFINQMERSPMFFIIDQVSVTGGRPAASTAVGGNSSSDPVKLEVQLEAFTQSTAPEAPATGGKP